MTLWVPQPSLKWIAESTDARPAGNVTIAFGTAITPGTAANGSWTTLLTAASVTDDIYGFHIWITSAITAANTHICLDIGANNSGGALAGGDIPIISDLIAGNASNPVQCGGGRYYYFPVFIPAGSNVAGRAQGSAATVINVYLDAYGAEKNSAMIKTGRKALVYGNTNDTGLGTALTVANTANGTWASLGTTTQDHFYWQVGVFRNNGTGNNMSAGCDLAVGNTTQNTLIIRRAWYFEEQGERQSFHNVPAYFHVPSGSEIVGRVQSSNLVTDYSMMAYGVCS